MDLGIQKIVEIKGVIAHEPSVIASTLWIGRDAVDQTWTL